MTDNKEYVCACVYNVCVMHCADAIIVELNIFGSDLYVNIYDILYIYMYVTGANCALITSFTLISR